MTQTDLADKQALPGRGVGCSERNSFYPGLEARFSARRREERGCGPVTGKDRASCQSGGAPAVRPGAVAQSPAERLLWPGRASPSASQLLAFSPGQEQAAGVWET